MYSQNDEEQVITSYFEGRTGRFLDIGAGHPFRFSNTRALYERGWKGVLVEPAPSFLPLHQAEYGSDPEMQVLGVCVGLENGVVDFWHSPNASVSTTVESELARWTDGREFVRTTAEMVDVPHLLARAKYKAFEFINIDTEGNVEEIMDQLDPRPLGCELMCVEWNSKNLEWFEAYFARFNWRPLYRSAENLIYARPS